MGEIFESFVDNVHQVIELSIFTPGSVTDCFESHKRFWVNVIFIIISNVMAME